MSWWYVVGGLLLVLAIYFGSAIAYGIYLGLRDGVEYYRADIRMLRKQSKLIPTFNFRLAPDLAKDREAKRRQLERDRQWDTLMEVTQ